jgi:hypothetical protein
METPSRRTVRIFNFSPGDLPSTINESALGAAMGNCLLTGPRRWTNFDLGLTPWRQRGDTVDDTLDERGVGQEEPEITAPVGWSD